MRVRHAAATQQARRLTEGIARHEGHARLLQQRHTEGSGVFEWQAAGGAFAQEGTDVGQHVKGPRGGLHHHTRDGAEAFQHKVPLAPHLIIERV